MQCRITHSPTPPLRGKTETIKIATLNINGITSNARIDMLENVLRVHDIDILFAQGNQPRNNEHRWIRDTPQHWIFHARHSNIGKGRHYSQKLTKLPSERAIAGEYRVTLLINIYAPSGTAKKHGREYFLTMNYHIYYNSQQPG